MNDIATFRKLLPQKLRSVIGLCDNYARCIHELIKSNLERPRHKNVVGVRGKAKRDWKKSVNPESGPRRHSRKVRRSEERRVGKESKFWWTQEESKKSL